MRWGRRILCLRVIVEGWIRGDGFLFMLLKGVGRGRLLLRRHLWIGLRWGLLRLLRWRLLRLVLLLYGRGLVIGLGGWRLIVGSLWCWVLLHWWRLMIGFS